MVVILDFVKNPYLSCLKSFRLKFGFKDDYPQIYYWDLLLCFFSFLKVNIAIDLDSSLAFNIALVLANLELRPLQ